MEDDHVAEQPQFRSIGACHRAEPTSYDRLSMLPNDHKPFGGDTLFRAWHGA